MTPLVSACVNVRCTAISTKNNNRPPQFFVGEHVSLIFWSHMQLRSQQVPSQSHAQHETCHQSIIITRMIIPNYS